LNWSQQLFVSLPGVPAAYDAFALHGGIPAGTTVSGFSVQFTWLGPGLPGSQTFQVFDPITFLSVQIGQTFSPAAPVPAASTWSLTAIGLGLGLAAALQARSRLGAGSFS